VSVSHADDTLALLSDVAADFAVPNAERVRALRDAGGGLDRTMWRRLADNGWLSIVVPEELGGAELGLEAAAIVARRLGYAGFPEPFVAAGVLAPAVLAAGKDPGRQHRIDSVLAGDIVAAVGWQGPQGGFEPAVGGVRATPGDDGTELSGVTRFIGVPDADGFVIAAREPDGIRLDWVVAGADGLTVHVEHTVDGIASPRLELDGVRVPDTDRLLPAPEGGVLLRAAVDLARVAVSAELLGVMDRALELTLDYLRQRKQFGAPIGSFQALQHRAADIWMQRELSAAALDAAIQVHMNRSSSETDRAAAASSVKARTAHAAPLMCTEALQLHGAIGFTDEYELGIYINRALALAPWLGNAAAHRRRYAELVPIGELA
jgi:alkylation response protein AidB-like acyl-CoA dehydrogenase